MQLSLTVPGDILTGDVTKFGDNFIEKSAWKDPQIISILIAHIACFNEKHPWAFVPTRQVFSFFQEQRPS